VAGDEVGGLVAEGRGGVGLGFSCVKGGKVRRGLTGSRGRT